MAAVGLYALRERNIEPFSKIDETTYSIVLTAGVIGGCAVLVELAIATAHRIKWCAKHINNSWKQHQVE